MYKEKKEVHTEVSRGTRGARIRDTEINTLLSNPYVTHQSMCMYLNTFMIHTHMNSNNTVAKQRSSVLTRLIYLARHLDLIQLKIRQKTIPGHNDKGGAEEDQTKITRFQVIHHSKLGDSILTYVRMYR